ncbi:DUF4258 domain-containing protein [Aeromonas veronii]|uniref:DUF4258 domain-containing protein n=1 Tax=Aeromonas TaxID=642 RepID=UPI001CC30114|nr:MULTISPECIES: DUF4258 domain-containing protein [Aeromonas]MEB5667983.1 DUF4258 domain-containing protein [Aeromonas veronii]
MNGKLVSAYSHHAACRMQQRGIAPELVELLLSIGRSSYHQGRELVYLDRKSVTMLQAGTECQRNAASGCAVTIWYCKTVRLSPSVIKPPTSNAIVTEAL